MASESTLHEKLHWRSLPPKCLYTYTRLPTPTSIRLVSFKSVGTGKDNLFELSIRVVDLQDSPTYDVLSYTWADY